jgi:hypothetical protein
MSLLVLCPSKDRPEKAHELLASFNATKSLDSTSLLFVLDDGEAGAYPAGRRMFVPPSGRRGMTDPLNKAFCAMSDDDEWDIIGFVGDDHRFKTPGWDQAFTDTLAEFGGGLIYGNDLNWPNGEIPTQIFGSTWIWKGLGWMALPTAAHLYLDNAWRVVGDGLERLYYMPEIVIEHEHPAYSKTDWDEGYRAVNSQEMYNRDREAFEEWMRSGKADEDLERVRQSAPR